MQLTNRLKMFCRRL